MDPCFYSMHDDVIKWKHFSCYWPFLRGICRSPVVPSQRAVTRSFGVFFDLRLNKQLSKQSNAGNLRRHRAQYDVTAMCQDVLIDMFFTFVLFFIPVLI